MGRLKKSEEPIEATEEPIENSVEVAELEPLQDEPVEKPRRPKREKSPAQIAAWDKLQIINKKKFEERKAAKERGEPVVPHGRNIDKQSKEVLEKLDKLENKVIAPPLVEVETTSEEEEVEVKPIPKKKVIKKKKRRIVVEQDSSSSEEEIVISRRRRSKKINLPTPSLPIDIPNDTPIEDTDIQKERPHKPVQEEQKKYTPTEILRGLGL
tara:strand:- start:820 stop:1452 length:633 start_codon:yes stop_codon:yes gene_type:complete